MDMPFEEYLKQLQIAIEAVSKLSKDMPVAVKKVVMDNFWQKQSGFHAKACREFDFKMGE